MKPDRFTAPLSAQELHGYEANYIFMAPDQLAAECRQLRASWPDFPPPRLAKRRAQAWALLMAAALDELPAVKPADSPELHACAQRALGFLPDTELAYLQSRLRQVEIRLALLPRSYQSASHARCCTLAVSPIWSRRMADVIGGWLYPAWVSQIWLDE